METVLRKETNKELFVRYAAVFGLTAKRGLPGGQHVVLDAAQDILGSFETTAGAYTADKPIFWFRQYQHDTWSGRQEDPYFLSPDDSSKAFTRREVLAAIDARRPLHDVLPDRRTQVA